MVPPVRARAASDRGFDDSADTIPIARANSSPSIIQVPTQVMSPNLVAGSASSAQPMGSGTDTEAGVQAILQQWQEVKTEQGTVERTYTQCAQTWPLASHVKLESMVEAPPGRVYGRICSKTKRSFLGHFHIAFFFRCFLGFHWHLRYCHVASPLKISPTHPMLETTTAWENSRAPGTLNSFGRNRVSSSSWSFSAVVCESFVFEPCINLFQWRAEFFVAFLSLSVSPLQSVLSLFC